jgi:serine/threonine kinase 38
MYKEIPLEQLLKEHKISQRTYDKVSVAKQYIESKYNMKTIKNIEWNEIIKRIDSLKICDKEKQKIKKEIYRQEMTKLRKAREKQSIKDYESIAIIGRGAFGEVHVCREKKTDKIYAIKKIKKNILILKNQIIHVLNEQKFMSRAKSPWIVELKASFQEDEYLYLVMEYLPGGDLMNLLIKKDILTEDEAKFYISELILAIESIHKLDCIHRDIKPDNVLIDKNGHIKLSDFGLAKISDKLYEKENEKYKNYIYEKKNKELDEVKKTHNKNFSCVGTAYYVAPEVLNKKGYDKEIDWWSVGIIFYEMLVGYAPFCSKETSEVCFKVLNWKKYLKIPSKIKISEEAKDLIFKMINSSNNRLGKNGAEEIKNHPFFNGVDWDNIRNSKPPFIPFLKNEYDTSYFENFEANEPFYPVPKNKFKRKDIEYIGYTFKEEFFNSSDLKKEYEQAIKSIENELKKEKENNNDKKVNNENIDLNITDNSNNRSWIKKKSLSKDISKNKDITQIPFRRASTSKQVKIPISTNLKLYNNKYKDIRNKDKQSTIPISLNTSKHKLNIIQLPLKKTKQKIYFSKKKIMHIINDSNNNTINSNEDSYNINNYTYRSVKTNKASNYNNNSYLINNNIKKYLNNISLNNSRKNNKLNLGPIYSNKRKLSPQQKGPVFIKKYFRNKKSISLKKLN